MRTYGQYCSVAKALDVVGDRWTLLVVRELLVQGPCRYTDLQDGLPGIATNLLSERLRQLEAAGVVERRNAAPPVATALFSLTPHGLALTPVLRALGIWGARYMVEPTGDEVFRNHWFSFPVSMFVEDTDPEGPPVSIELKTNEGSFIVESADGEISTRIGADNESTDFSLEGEPMLIMGVIAGFLTLPEARASGLATTGKPAALRRLFPPHRSPAPEAA